MSEDNLLWNTPRMCLSYAEGKPSLERGHLTLYDDTEHPTANHTSIVSSSYAKESNRMA